MTEESRDFTTAHTESPYIVLRTDAQGIAYVVYATDKIKDARYWLNYIAQPGDGLFHSSSHPRYAGNNGKPEYKSHLVGRGNIAYDEKQWLALNKILDSQLRFQWEI